MNKLLILLVLVVSIGVGIMYWKSQINPVPFPLPLQQVNPVVSETSNSSQTTVMASNLDTPWALAFLPDGSMLVTERPGRVRLIDVSQKRDPIGLITIASAKEIGEGGLLGITLHPNFSENNFVYLYYTYKGNGNNTFNRVVRMVYKDKELSDEKVLVDDIPGSSNHNGGRIKFGPDKMLYIATGDAENPSQAQDKNTLGGKILRVTDEGKPAPINPFNNLIYSYGHRNVQGLAWDSNGTLWATEHGRSGIQSGLDELNLIEGGENYGWPLIQGDETKEGMETARSNSSSSVTWAPSGAAFVGNSLFFAGLRGQTLYEAVLENGQAMEIKEHLKGQFGRLREVITGPDNMLYITTSNKDGRGIAKTDDDKIIRINPAAL